MVTWLSPRRLLHAENYNSDRMSNVHAHVSTSLKRIQAHKQQNSLKCSPSLFYSVPSLWKPFNFLPQKNWLFLHHFFQKVIVLSQSPPSKGHASSTGPWTQGLFFALLFCQKPICFAFGLSISSSFHHKSPKNCLESVESSLVGRKGRGLSRTSQNLPHMLITFVPSQLLSTRQSNNTLNVYMVPIQAHFQRSF